MTTQLIRSGHDMSPLYASTLCRVKMILARDYKMTSAEIEQAIAAYQLEEFFIADADMAAHDSNEDWARRIYEFWCA